MKTIQPWQLRTMHAIARSIGIDNDDLHSLAFCIAGETSLKELSFAQAAALIADLNARQKLAGVSAPKRSARKHPTTPGGVTSEQQGKAWALMYELEKHDPGKDGVSVGTRLCGLITSHFKVTAPPAQPFRFMKMAQGIELIHVLAKMVEQAERKAIHEGGVRYG